MSAHRVFPRISAVMREHCGPHGWPEIERIAWAVDQLAEEHDALAADPIATPLAVRLAAERHAGALIVLTYAMGGGGCHRCGPWGGLGFVPELRRGATGLLDLCPRCGEVEP